MLCGTPCVAACSQFSVRVPLARPCEGRRSLGRPGGACVTCLSMKDVAAPQRTCALPISCQPCKQVMRSACNQALAAAGRHPGGDRVCRGRDQAPAVRARLPVRPDHDRRPVADHGAAGARSLSQQTRCHGQGCGCGVRHEGALLSRARTLSTVASVTTHPSAWRVQLQLHGLPRAQRRTLPHLLRRTTRVHNLARMH